MTKTDDRTKAIERINHGLTSVFFKNYVGSAAPPGWKLDHAIQAFPALDDPSSCTIFVCAKAWSPSDRPIGAKITVDVKDDLQAIAARLSMELWNACASASLKEVGPFEELRFALADGAIPPVRGSEGASGYDLHAISRVVINPGQVTVVDTGVIIELPRGYEAQVRPRSGMSKRGLWVALGTVDSDYRGTIGATIINHAREMQTIDQGHRIAQLVIASVVHRPWRLVERADLTTTDRGERGWGSTGL